MLKARDNPLASDRVLSLIRYRPVGTTWPQLLARAAALNWRCAIVGAKGTGKTTLLEDLQNDLRATDRATRLIRLSAERGQISPGAIGHVSSNEIILLDGAEQLSPLRWSRFRWRTRLAAGVVITTHSPGRLPTLIETRTTPQLLADILQTLLGRKQEEIETVPLLARHGGNVREALRDLYDRLGAAHAATPAHGYTRHDDRAVRMPV
jgi:hypothetical protein